MPLGLTTRVLVPCVCRLLPTHLQLRVFEPAPENTRLIVLGAPTPSDCLGLLLPSPESQASSSAYRSCLTPCAYACAVPGSVSAFSATNVAETSLTIPGIKYVIDPGREKRKVYDKARLTD